MKEGTKKAKILEYMKSHYYITSMDAFTLFNETRLAAVVFELRKEGYSIRTDKETTKDGTPYAKYHLILPFE